MNLIRLDDENCCLGGQKSDGPDGGVLDQQFSNSGAGMNEQAGYLNGQTERWAIDHGITGQSQVFEQDFASTFDDRHTRRAEHLREVDWS